MHYRYFMMKKLVGTLAMTADRKAAFNIVKNGLKMVFRSVRFHFPLKTQVFSTDKRFILTDYLEVFADSLPDNWGRLLLDRLLRAHKQNPDKLTVLDRLAIVGKSGMGALTYYPEKKK